jgi:hypothetical protein
LKGKIFVKPSRRRSISADGLKNLLLTNKRVPKRLNGQIGTLAQTNGDTFVLTFDVLAANYQGYLPNPTKINLSLQANEIVADQFWNEIDNSLPKKDYDDHQHEGKNDDDHR